MESDASVTNATDPAPPPPCANGDTIALPTCQIPPNILEFESLYMTKLEFIAWVEDICLREGGFAVLLVQEFETDKGKQYNLIFACEHSGCPRATGKSKKGTNITSSKKFGCTVLLRFRCYCSPFRYKDGHPYTWRRILGTDWKKKREHEHNHSVFPNVYREAKELVETPGEQALLSSFTSPSQYAGGPASPHDPAVMAAALRQARAKESKKRSALNKKYGSAGAVLVKLGELKAYYTVHVDAEGKIPRIFFAFPTNIVLARRYHYALYVDATYQTNHEDYRLFNIVSTTGNKQSFVVAQALLRDETAESVEWTMKELQCLFTRVGIARWEEIMVIEHDIQRQVDPCGFSRNTPLASLYNGTQIAQTPSVRSDSLLNEVLSSERIPGAVRRMRIAIPSVMCCDRSMMTITAIGNVFPRTSRRLCVWHVWENVVGYFLGVKKDVRVRVLGMAHRMLSARTEEEALREFESTKTYLESCNLTAAAGKLDKLRPHLDEICEYSHRWCNMRVRATSVVESVNAAIKKHFRNQGGKKRMLQLVEGLHNHSWNVYSKIKANIPWHHRLTAHDDDDLTKHVTALHTADRMIPRQVVECIAGLRAELRSHTAAYDKANEQWPIDPRDVNIHRLKSECDAHSAAIRKVLRTAREMGFPLHDSTAHNPLAYLHPQHFLYLLPEAEDVQPVFSETFPEGKVISRCDLACAADRVGRPTNTDTLRSVIARNEARRDAAHSLFGDDDLFAQTDLLMRMGTSPSQSSEMDPAFSQSDSVVASTTEADTLGADAVDPILSEAHAEPTLPREDPLVIAASRREMLDDVDAFLRERFQRDPVTLLFAASRVVATLRKLHNVATKTGAPTLKSSTKRSHSKAERVQKPTEASLAVESSGVKRGECTTPAEEVVVVRSAAESPERKRPKRTATPRGAATAAGCHRVLGRTHTEAIIALSRKRGPRVCAACNEPGHTHFKCPAVIAEGTEFSAMKQSLL